MSKKETKVVYKDQGLGNLGDVLKKKLPQIKVGILGENSSREGTLNNATIGLYHEYGTVNKKQEEVLPQRSFLRMPLNLNFEKTLEGKNALSEETIKKIIDEKSFEEFAKKLAQTGVDVIQEAFHTGGFGEWAALSTPNKTGNILVDTTQLRESINYEVS